MTNLAIQSFNAGKLTPQIDARSDVDKYRSGCRIIENFIPRIYGCVERRPGTKFIASVETASKKSRLVSFIFSSSIAYLLEFGDQVIRVYFDGVQVGSDIVSPYLEADLPELDVSGQSADVMWITHKSYAPRKLSRTSVTTFSLDTTTFSDGPFRTRNDIANDDDVTIAVTGYTIATATAAATNQFTITIATDISSLFPDNQIFYVSSSTGNDGSFTVSSSSYTAGVLTITTNEDVPDGTNDGQIMVAGGEVTLTASSATFTIGTSGHTGALFKLTHARLNAATTGTSTGTSTGIVGKAIEIKGDFRLRSHSTWSGTVELQRLEDGSVWETSETFISVNDSNINASFTEELPGILYRIFVTEHASGGSIPLELTVVDTTQDSIFRITATASTTSVTATAVIPAPVTTATKRWFEGSWSAVRGYPKTFAFFEERAVYAGTTADPNTIWFSAIDGFETFEEGLNDDDSFSLTLPDADEIRWIAALEAFVIGTSGGEWRIRATSIDAALTPSDFNVRQQTSYGSKSIQAIKVNAAILFTDFVGRKIHEMTFIDELQKFRAPDLSALAEDITLTGIVAYAYQRNPESILWLVLANGTLLSMTYEREQDVIAWAEHSFSGDVESVAVIPGSAEDEVWITVKRTINGATVRYIEQMQPRVFSDRDDAFFVDSGVIYDDVATTTITGLDHLEGKEVQVYADSAVQSKKTVSSGSITLDKSASTVHVGLGFTSRVQSMRFDVDGAGGTTQGSIKTIPEIVISLLNSANVRFGNPDKSFPVINRTTEPYDSPPDLFTGLKELSWEGGFNVDDPVIISCSDPVPCTVRGIVLRLKKAGR